MGRFYKTAKPKFVEDFAYKEPIEEMYAYLNAKQQGYNAALVAPDEVRSSLVKDVNSIPDPVEREKLAQILKTYEDETNNIVKGIQDDDATNYESHLPKIAELRRKLQDDITAGPLSRIKSTYDNYGKAVADNKNHPLYEQAMQVYFNRWKKKNPNGSEDGVFDYFKLPEVPTIKEEHLKQLQEDAEVKLTPDGKWLNTKSGISKERYADFAEGILRNQPSYDAYIQMQRDVFGDESYDLDKNPTLMTTAYSLPNGTTMSPEDFEKERAKLTDVKLTEKEKKEVYERLKGAEPVNTFNPNSSWKQLQFLAKGSQYEKQGQDISKVYANDSDNATKLKIEREGNASAERMHRKSMQLQKDLAGLTPIQITGFINNSETRKGIAYGAGSQYLEAVMGTKISPEEIREAIQLEKAAKASGKKVTTPLEQKLEQYKKYHSVSDYNKIINNLNTIVTKGTNEGSYGTVGYSQLYANKGQDAINRIIQHEQKTMVENPQVYLDKPFTFEGKPYKNLKEFEKAKGLKFDEAAKEAADKKVFPNVQEVKDGESKSVFTIPLIDPLQSGLVVNDAGDITSAANYRILTLHDTYGKEYTIQQPYKYYIPTIEK